MLCKDAVTGMTRWSADCEKITSVHTPDKRLVSKTHKELNNEQTTQFKNRQMVGTDTSPNQLYRRWVHVWKSGARRMLSGDFRWTQQREVAAPSLAGPGPKHWRQQCRRGWGQQSLCATAGDTDGSEDSLPGSQVFTQIRWKLMSSQNPARQCLQQLYLGVFSVWMDTTGAPVRWNMIRNRDKDTWAIQPWEDKGERKSLLQRKRSPSDGYCKISTVWHSGKGQITEMVKGSVSYLQGLRARGWDEQEVEWSPHISNTVPVMLHPLWVISHTDAKHVKGDRWYIETDSCPNIFYKPKVNAAAGICWVSSRCCGPC